MSTAGERDPSELDAILPGGMSEAGLLDAIRVSGYPLQTVIGTALEARQFEVTEEWAYEDPDQGVRRSMDILAISPVSKNPHATEAGMGALDVVLVIECKQSRNPYVFFEAIAPPGFEKFPLITGLGDNDVELYPEIEWDGLPHMKKHNMPFSRKTSIQNFLGLHDDQLVTAPPVVASVSKATASGTKVRLSGEEPYNALILPLTKAAGVYLSGLWHHRGGQGDEIHSVRISIPVAVLDAPMVLIEKLGASEHPKPTSWVRVVSRRPSLRREERPFWDPLEYDVIDVVHRDFFETYVDDFVIPYATRLWEGHTAYHDVTVGGGVIVEGLEKTGPLPEALLGKLVQPI